MRKLATPQDEYIRTALRLPRGLHESVKSAARAAGHTMNSEIIARLAEAEEHASFKTILKQNEELKKLMLVMMEAINEIK